MTYQDILHSVWLHANWYAQTKPLTTDEKEAFADAVEAASARLDPNDPVEVERWWRPDYSAAARAMQRLADEAAKQGMTLDEYVDSLLTPDAVRRTVEGVMGWPSR
jgi:hypothetical protein